MPRRLRIGHKPPPTITAEHATYVAAGQPAALRVGKTFRAERGTHAVTGQAAATRRSRVVQAAQGAYAVGGRDATLLKGALGTSITSFTLTTSAATGTYPFTVGLGFRRGDVPSGVSVALNIPNFQVAKKRSWPDGSLKHAVVSGRADLTQNVARTVTVALGTPPGGTNLTATSIFNLTPSASITFGSLGTVTLASLLGSPIRTWLSGPECAEAHYRGELAGTKLSAFFHVKLYVDGRLWVRAIAENGYLDNGSGAVDSPVTYTYAATVSVGGVTVFSGTLTHYTHTRWMAEGWINGDPQVVAIPEVGYLRSTKLVPNYGGYGAPSGGTLSALDQTYVPMDRGPHEESMGGTGAQLGIGLLPHWDACFVASGDVRAYRAALVGSSSLNTYAIAKRTRDGAVLKLSSFGTWTLDGPGAGGDTITGAGTNVWDIAHHPSGGYLPFIVTGDYWYLDTLALQASTCFLLVSSSEGTGVNRMFFGGNQTTPQPRAAAWCLRTVGQYASIAPDAELAAGEIAGEYRTLLANNYAGLKTRLVSNNTMVWSGVPIVREYNLWDYPLDNTQPYTGSIPPWMYDFWISANGANSESGALDADSDLIYVRNWMYRWIVGRMGASGRSSEYPFTHAAMYGMRVATDDSGSTWYQTFGDFFQVTHGSLNTTVSNTLTGGNIGNSFGGANSYWGNCIPAIAYAVDHQAPGARAAYQRLIGATNWGTLAAGFLTWVPFAVAPRESRVAPYSVAANQSILVGTNTARAAKPAGMTDGTFDNATFGSYSGGTYVPWYGRAGAYVMGPCGGHNNEYFYDQCIFPFDSSVSAAVTWAPKVNGNGVSAVNNSAPSANDIADSNGSPYYEKTNATSGQMPVGAHTYGSLIALQEGRLGSLLFGTRGAVCNESVPGPSTHKQDLESAQWTRFVTGTAGDSAHVEGWAVLDPNTNRVYFGHDSFWGRNTLHYAHVGTRTYSSVVTGFPSGPAQGAYIKAVAFEKRRLILWHDTQGNVWAWDTLTPTVAPSFVQTQGSFAVNDGQAKFRWDEDNGFFVQKPGWTGNVVNVLIPPNDRTTGKGGVWTKGSRTIAGAGLPNGVKGPQVQVPQFTQHDWSEELGLHMWVADSTTLVALFDVSPT
jgi:hypothetical protein